MANIPTSIYITHLEREGSFVKVWGQTDRSLPIAIEKALQQMTPQFEQGMYSPAIGNFQVGMMCCAKFKDELYYRARITNVSYLTQGMVEVLFVDYGNRDVISCMNTRTLSGLQTGLISIPAQAKDFILAHVTLHNWEFSNFEMICRELRYLEFQLAPVLEVGPYTLISLYLNKQDIAESLIERGLLLKIPIQFQQMTLQPLIARSAPSALPIATHHQLPMPISPMQPKITPVAQPIPTPTLLTYKALPLENESEHQVYISYVSDGPCLFSVQLKKMEEQLKRLMTEINCMELQPLEEYPLPGTVCLAQSSEDGYICRAVVTSMIDGQYKVFYVDFGNTELLAFDKLFQIPFKYVIPKVMATRFALAGLENATVSIEMKCKFKDFVNNRPLFMKVKPAATKSALPLCELWDENNIKAIEMIKQAALSSYPEQAPLSRGLNQDVRVCFVYSCNKIYVQLKSKANDLQQLMNGLQETCYSRPLFDRNELKVGSPCCVLFPDDNMWYRGEILQIDGECFKVKYVDFGNENIVEYDNVKVPLPEHVTALRPQAIECCLNGYQNIEPNEQRDILLEELIFEQDLSMKVVEIQGNRALVDLYDKQHYNVASLLLEKIASATSMVSPLLIQDNHRIEHRKRSPPQGNQREFRDKKPLRELNDRNRGDKQENWRQNKFSRNDEKKTFTPNKHNFFQRKNTRNNDDNWNEQAQTESQDRYHKTNNRHNEDWRSPESPANQNSFDHDDRRSIDQRGKNFASRDNFEQTSNNDNYHNAKDDFENKNFSAREKRNDFRGKGGFDRRDDFNKRDGFEKKDGFNRRGGFEKRDDFNRRDDFNKRDDFHRKDGFDRGDNFERKDGFDRKEGSKRFNRNQSGPNRKPDYGKSNRGLNDSRSSDENYSKPKNRDYKRDDSEKSWSDASEKSWKRGPKSFDRQRNNKFGGARKGFSPTNNEVISPTEDWNTSTLADNLSSSTTVYDYAADTDKFKNYIDLSGTDETVSVSWFYNPINFYCQLDKYKNQFRQMMEEIQTCYRNRQTGSANDGAPAIAPFSEDGALYRVEILSSQFKEYHVKYIDYGNVATVTKVYPIEKKYMELPAQAIPCGLQGISSYNDNWQEPDAYSSYFDKDNFSCQFISLLENRYSVDLSHDGNSVSTLLIEAGLAFSTQTTTDIDTNLLVSQQIIVVLKNVVSASDITLEIENSITVKASMHNLKDATEINEDILKQWIGHFVIAYIDGVSEDRLEITLYDLTGQKLPVLVPDEGAYDNVDPLCPLPIYSNRIQGCVSHASEESIYLQPSKFSQSIEQLLDALFEHYSAVTQEEPLTPVEGEVYAVLSSDSNWYRGSVTEIKDDQVIVTYVDYGNSESTPITNLRELSPQFYQPHMLAVEILIPGEKQHYLEQDITVSVKYGSLGWEGQIVSEEVMETENAAVLPQAQDEAMAEVDVVESTSNQEQIMPEESTPPTQSGARVIISHIDTPSEFYLQLSDASESIKHLQDELQAQIPSMPNLENPTAGVLCAARYFVCQQWYRAQVLDADDDITTVRFVDFGNTDVITNPQVHIKTLPSEMLSIEFHSKLCSLNVKPTGEEWSAAAIELFQNNTSVENLIAEIIHQDEKTTFVELYADGKNIGETLKQEGLAVDLQLETENSSTGFISHLNSPSEFWIQLESSCSDLEWVADQLSNADNYPALEDLTPGSLCAAIFSDDDSWYRARILSNTVAGLEVIFIDYGNSCSCNGLRELPEDLIMLSPLALKCSLQKPNGVLQWSQAATEKFKEISADGATVFDVNVLTPEETSIVQLTYNGMDVSLQLVPETRQCFVTYVDSLESFWVQFMDDNALIENMTAEMENADPWPVITDPEENSLVAALFEDGVWYRMKNLGQRDVEYEGFFIDYGNTCFTSEMRQLPEECAAIKPLATKYKLDMLPRTKWGGKSEELFKNMTQHGATMFDAEIVSEDTLRLYLNGVDVRSYLECVKCTPSPSLQSSPKKKPAQSVPETIPAGSEIDDVIKTEIIIESDGNITHDDVKEETMVDENAVPEESIKPTDVKEEIVLEDSANAIGEEIVIPENLLVEDDANAVPEEGTMHDDVKEEMVLDDNDISIPKENLMLVEDNAAIISEENITHDDVKEETMVTDDDKQNPKGSIMHGNLNKDLLLEDGANPISEESTTHGDVKEEIKFDADDSKTPTKSLMQDASKKEMLIEDNANTIAEKRITRDNLEGEIKVEGGDKVPEETLIPDNFKEETFSSLNLRGDEEGDENAQINEPTSTSSKHTSPTKARDRLNEENKQDSSNSSGNIDKTETPSIIKECKNIDIKKIIESQLEDVIEKVTSNSAIEVNQTQPAVDRLEPQCDTSSEEARKSVPANPVGELDVKDKKTIECNKPPEIAITDKEDACDENKLTVETSDIGHSPEKDKINKEAPTDG